VQFEALGAKEIAEKVWNWVEIMGNLELPGLKPYLFCWLLCGG
jgi:hypothetical protein